VLVFTNVQLIGSGARARAKRQVCLSNLRTLTAAWHIYADDNAGKIVNGAPRAPGGPCLGCSYNCAARLPSPGSWDYDLHQNELPWVGVGWGSMDISAPECCQKCAIDTGLLWKYLKEYDIYSCPAGMQGEWVTYAVIDSMNGQYYHRGYDSTLLKSLVVKSKNQIVKPAKRVVFIDEGRQTPDSFAVFYDRPEWFDTPPIRHGKGTTASYADGHSEYWKWKGHATLTCGEEGGCRCPLPWDSSCEDFQDLYRMQISCWGRIGYDLQAIAGSSCPLVWD